MGRAIPAAERPTIEQLEQIISQKDEAVRQAYWNATTIRSIAWLAYQAHDSGNVDYSETEYNEAARYTLQFIAQHSRRSSDELEDAHGGARYDVLNAPKAEGGQS